MKKLLLVLLLAVVAGGPVTPILSSVLGFAPATAHANNDQGDDNDDQGEDEQ